MTQDLKTTIGFDKQGRKAVLQDRFLIEYVNLRLASMGLPHFQKENYPFMQLARPLLQSYQHKVDLLQDHLSPVDQRIQNFLDSYLGDVEDETPRLPTNSLILDRHGMSRILSLPPDRDKFESDIVSSFRVKQGVLHNPKSDRRTTKGTFHITEGGLPIPADKIAVPKKTFCRILKHALNAPSELKRLPFTASQEEKAESWVSIMLRPTICPEVEGFTPRKSMEVRFFAPGNLVSNLDFVETIFGNAGDPNLPENDSALDVEHWSGHTGCVILAPHLIYLTKQELGLPHIDDATERQKRDGMCWSDPDEKYNNGSAFKLTARNKEGVVVTIIADNYFGYCKKEVKTQISYATNLYGQTEEEHAGGAVAFPSYDLGEDFQVTPVLRNQLRADDEHSFKSMCELMSDAIALQPQGFAIDRKFADIYYVPEDAFFTLIDQTVSWDHEGKKESICLKPGITYVLPFGYKVEMVRPDEGKRWRLIGRIAEGTFCHKPSTVSGGGKSEISKPVTDAVVYGPVFVADFEKDMDFVGKLVTHNYGKRFKDEKLNRDEGRPILGTDRSLGSVIKLLTPSDEYTDEFNAFLKTIPHHIRQLVFTLKRVYKPDWGDDWRKRFSVDIVDGDYGNELKFKDQKLNASFMRVGYTQDNKWRTFGLRKDYFPAQKLQAEDDITASVVVPTSQIEHLDSDISSETVKFSENCEYRLFQRPDEAVHRGYDKTTELDMSRPGNFLSNYEPLTQEDVSTMIDNTIQFQRFTEPMKNLLTDFVAEGRFTYTVSSANPRLVDGKPTKNPRYLQDRGDLQNERDYYISDVGTRLYRRIPLGRSIPRPVNAVLPGRRNNPPEEGIRPLCVFNPIHYMPLPELFMEFISSMTGKSPSTTGAGSEGAMTKGPFNALCPISDLNNALVSYMSTGHHSFITAAGYVGPYCRVDHDISYLMPELWCRMSVQERDPQYLVENGFLEQCADFYHQGETVRASFLGYRITDRFVRTFFGRIFGDPGALFDESMLRPEQQDMDIFADGMLNICATHKRVAKLYFEDGSIEDACPPLRALLHIMAEGQYEGKDVSHPDIRMLFRRENMIKSDWYTKRLEAYRSSQEILWSEHLAYLHEQEHKDELLKHHGIDIKDRVRYAETQLDQIRAKDFLSKIHGTLGLDPCLLPEV